MKKNKGCLKNIAVFASGRGSNFAAIAKAVKAKKISASLALLVCDNEKAPVIRKAAAFKVPVVLVKRENFATREEFEQKIGLYLRQYQIDLIALAGFMRILSPYLVGLYRNRIINIHPALLPAFKGGHAIADAFNYGVQITGVTVHFVDEQMDHGPIIAQEAVIVRPADTLVSLEARIHAVEHRLYPQVIQRIVTGKGANPAV